MRIFSYALIALTLIALTLIALTLTATGASAQVKPGKPYDPSIAVQKDKNQGQWKPRANHWNASAATKEMLIKHGYKVVGMEQFPDGNVLYFRRDGAASVQQIGAVEKVVIRPNGDTVAIEGAPREVLADVRLKLGMQ